MSSVDVTEICTFVEATNVAKGLLGYLGLLDDRNNDGVFNITCEDIHCDSVRALLEDKKNYNCNKSPNSAVVTCN